MGQDTGSLARMSSGVAVSDECKTYFEDIKKAKKYRYVVFYIQGEKSIMMESVGNRDASYDDFLTDLQRVETGSAGTACTTSSTSTSVRELRSPARSRSCSSWPGAQTAPRSRRRCSTPPPLTPSRSLWLECTNISRRPI